MIYLSNRISTVFIFFTTFLLFLTICLVNLPMSPGCGDWTAGLFYRDDPYTVARFRGRDINSVFMSISFGWFFICCGFFLSCLQVLLLWSLPFFLLFLLFLFILFACMSRNSPIYCVYSTLCFFVNMNCTTPHTLAYGFHLIGNLDWAKNVVFYL